MIRSGSVPRLAPSTISRPRLERWLGSHANVPLRLVVAPAGSGKTSLLVKYLSDSGTEGMYCALPQDCGAADLLQTLRVAVGASGSSQSFEALIHGLRERGAPFELAIDDAHNAVGDAADLLRALVENVPESAALIFASRSREAVDAQRWIGRGLAVLCDARRLAFDAPEVEVLAEACGVRASHNDVVRLIEETDGWAVVVSGCVRSALEDGRSLADAFDHWRMRYGQVFTEFLSAELERFSEEDRATVRSILSGAAVEDDASLQRLEARGIFAVEDVDGCRPYRPLRYLRGVRAEQGGAPPPLVVRMFGHFQAQIGGREIEWVRRRDQQLVKYLLLKPSGRATRAELASVFWPDADAQLAGQSVRTACSNIRKALAAAVGYARVDSYFRADPDVSIDPSHVIADVRRFGAHVGDGDAAFDRGDLPEAVARYRAAEEIYAGRLLDADPPEPWFTAQGQLFEDRYVIVLERLAQASFDEGDVKAASEYAYRVQQLRPDASGLVKMLGTVAPQYRERTRPSSLEERRRRRGA